MEIIDNVNKTLKDDMAVTLCSGSKVAIAASCFSIYAFQELKEQLDGISELRFIFTSPSFITEKTDKQKREFYIPRLNRERDLYGSEFEIKLRNELSLKAVTKSVKGAFQKFGMVKYNAFKGMGGNLSFAFAMLDLNNTGFILNSVHSREGCYLYIKDVVNGEAEITLGNEEKEALEQALGY